MKVVGKRRIPAQPWFGAVEKDAKPAKYEFAELEKAVRAWFVKEAK